MKKKQGEMDNISKPKAVKKDNRIGSKTAPLETDFNFDVENNEDYIATYNYYIYYNSIKPRDPRLPKPTYTPMPDMDFIKEGTKQDREPNEHDDDYEQMEMNKFLNEDDKLESMINNLDIKGTAAIPEVSEDLYEQLNPQIIKGNDQKQMDMYNIYTDLHQNIEQQLQQQLQPNIQMQQQQQQQQPQLAQLTQQQQQQQQTQMLPQSQSQPGQNMFNYMLDTTKPQSTQLQTMDPFNYGNYANMNPMNYQPEPNAYYQPQSGYPNMMKGGGGGQGQGKYNNKMQHQQQSMQPSMYNMPMDRNMTGGGGSNYGQSQSQQDMMMNPYGNMMGMYPQSQPPNQIGGMNMNMPMNSMNVQNMQMFNVYMKQPYGNNNMSNMGNMNNMGNMKGYSKQRGMNQNAMQNMNYMKRSLYSEQNTYEEVLNALPEICKDHTGSRIFQKRYEDASIDKKKLLLQKIMPEVYSLSKDVFGNYVIQRLLESISPEEKKEMIAQLQGKIKELTLHMYGCRVIQKAIEIADTDDVLLHLNELQEDLIKSIQDQNGNHVIQKLIEKLPKGQHKQILSTIKGRVYELSIHQYGCRVVQRIFEYCSDQEKISVLTEINSRITDLCLDQYGNYVIQNIAEKMTSNDLIFNSLKKNVVDFSLHKFASNVIEKCLGVGTKPQIALIVNELIEQDNKTNDTLLALVKDKYGNYVVQKMIEVAEMKSKEILVKKIINSQVLKKRDGFSKHVMSMIEKMGLTSLLNQTNNNKPK